MVVGCVCLVCLPCAFCLCVGDVPDHPPTGIAEDAAALTEAMEEEALEEEFGEAGAELLGEHGDPLTKAPKGACVRTWVGALVLVVVIVLCECVTQFNHRPPSDKPGFNKAHENIELLKNRRFVMVKTFADDVRGSLVYH